MKILIFSIIIFFSSFVYPSEPLFATSLDLGTSYNRGAMDSQTLSLNA